MTAIPARRHTANQRALDCDIGPEADIPHINFANLGEIIYMMMQTSFKILNFLYVSHSEQTGNFSLTNVPWLFLPRVANTNIYKICELHRAIFSSFYNI